MLKTYVDNHKVSTFDLYIRNRNFQTQFSSKPKINILSNNVPGCNVTGGDRCVMKATLGLYPESTAGEVSHDLLL